MMYSISTRELEVLQLIANEMSAKEITSQLFLSRHTVETHKKNIKVKLNVKNAAGMVRKGFELGILKISAA